MYRYWPVRPENRSTAVAACSGVKEVKSATASNSAAPSTARTASGSRTSAWTVRTSSGTARRVDSPRFSTVTSQPRCNATGTHAALIWPVPPMNSTLDMAWLLSSRSTYPLTGRSTALPGVPPAGSVLPDRQVPEPVQGAGDGLLAQHAEQLAASGGEHLPGQRSDVGTLVRGRLPQPGHLTDPAHPASHASAAAATAGRRLTATGTPAHAAASTIRPTSTGRPSAPARIASSGTGR